jgi:hypothetical protein
MADAVVARISRLICFGVFGAANRILTRTGQERTYRRFAHSRRGRMSAFAATQGSAIRASSCEGYAVSTGMGVAHSIRFVGERCQFITGEFLVYFGHLGGKAVIGALLAIADETRDLRI